MFYFLRDNSVKCFGDFTTDLQSVRSVTGSSHEDLCKNKCVFKDVCLKSAKWQNLLNLDGLKKTNNKKSPFQSRQHPNVATVYALSQG